MKKIKRLLAAVLITSMLFGSNGISYAAEAAGNANEAAVETAVQEQQSDFNEEKSAAVETETDDRGAGAEKAEPVFEQEEDPASEEAAEEAQADHAEAADSVEEAETAEDEAASDKGVADARFFDITIWAKGQEIQPQSAVRVNISYNNAIEVADEGEVTAMHFEDGSGDAEVLHTDTNGGSEVSEMTRMKRP